MKRHIKNILIIIPIFLVSLLSCDDYLELKPKDNLIQQEFWQNKEQVAAAVAGCYASMNQSSFTDRVLLWGELRAEMLVSRRASNAALNLMNNFMIPTNTLVSWNSFYATINYCNLVLEFADAAKENDLSFTQQELDNFKAEVLTIRSLVYFILVRNFKEVPLVLTATSNSQVDFYPAKNTEEEIITQIIEDLKLAVSDLNLGATLSAAYDKGRMTKGAALAILSDVYLWSNQFDNCIDTCNEIVSLGKYSLVGGSEWFDKIFFEGNSSEGIFELQFSDINATFRNSFWIGNPLYGTYVGIIELYEEFPNDIRADFATYDAQTNAIYKYAGVDAAGTYRGQDEFFNNFIFYRYADVLLMQAEAYLLSSNNKNLDRAKDLINAVHQRATGVPLEVVINETSLQEALLLERQKEFAYEGKRWYDLLRFARRNNFERQELILDLVDVKASADNYEQLLSYYSDSESYYLPIPQADINLNDNLIQNPYYQN
ncbi:RagB/SusD family nutrient uptake outer membrane protein [uncultured Polaribacter sp.]|uniref:RagB/SusD family nutrient uptake outer membrane protein n=1 Tax=uncultured Polaribacter sp. TaxID=174711 RepID=UPI002611A2B3|nr:RagB/SusD family nutrient uptake outer membrane protein [uncultured Polaribacter sp.]